MYMNIIDHSTACTYSSALYKLNYEHVVVNRFQKMKQLCEMCELVATMETQCHMHVLTELPIAILGKCIVIQRPQGKKYM